jgi:hypothetical protein
MNPAAKSVCWSGCNSSNRPDIANAGPPKLSFLKAYPETTYGRKSEPFLEISTVIKGHVVP